MAEEQRVRGACPMDCPDTCSWIVTIKDGRAVKLEGDRAHPFSKGKIMKHRWLWIICAALSIFIVSQTGRGPEAQTGQSSDAQNKRGLYAHIGFLRPHDGHIVDFEAGYIRRLQWHKQARDAWVWYGWNV